MRREDVDLSYSNINEKYGNLLIAANPDKFWSWKNAIEAAGFDYDEINKYADRITWDRDLVIKTIRDLYSRGEDLSDSYVTAHNAALMNGARRILGSWKNAINMADLDYNKIRKDIKTEFFKGKLLERYLLEICGNRKRSGTAKTI